MNPVEPLVEPPHLLELRPVNGFMQQPGNDPHNPSTKEFRGDYGFYVNCARQEKLAKSANYTYDEHHRKLFVNMNVVCPFHVHVDKVPPLGTTLRVMAVYANPNDVRSVVKRCLIHMDPYNATNSKSIIPAVHVIRCESPCAAYKEDPTTGRHSVVIEYNNPEAGMGYRVYHYRFMCLSSCSHGEGMNRRPIKIIFTLEHGNCVLGRLSMDVKICRCPGRDRRNEDKSRLPPTSSTDQAKGQKKRKPNGKSTGIEVPPKTKKLSPSDTENDQQGIFQLQCSSRAIFDALRPIRDALEFYSTQHVDGRWLAGPSGSPGVKLEPSEEDSDETPE
ncbi:cellular tumor antigen p53 isoform X3 [Ixodes scapularis]|nr:cellular tumor antigen p53 isoform X3 [Ixodes scapularis]